MNIVVLGAGVIGVTSAYYLAKAGHTVTVIDRQPGPALETSFANAGEVSPGYSSPWAAPGVPMKALKWLFMKHAPLILHPTADPATLRWMLALLRNCTAERYKVNKGRMVRLAEYSRDRLADLRAETGIAYDQRMQGTLQVFRTQKQLDAIAKDIEVLRADGVPFEVLDRAGCVAAEPGLAQAAERIVGGLRLPGDETGDCFKFTEALAELCRGMGVTFRFGVDIRGLKRAGGQRTGQASGKVTAVETATGDIAGDLFIAALGSYTPALLAPLGLRLPIYPVKGYSITMAVVDEARAPVSTVMDETFKVAITRLGSRVRVGGMAEIAGFNRDLNDARRSTLLHSVGDLFAGAADTREVNFWTGLRPMTPDGTPIIGATSCPNLYINAGHGTLGWTMACGSGAVLADLVNGQRPAIEAADLALSRYA